MNGISSLFQYSLSSPIALVIIYGDHFQMLSLAKTFFVFGFGFAFGFLIPKLYIYLPYGNFYLQFGTLKLVSKGRYHFFLQNLISPVIPFLMNTIIHPDFVNTNVPSRLFLVTNLPWWPSIVDYIYLSTLLVIVFPAFLLLLKTSFQHFLACLSKYASNLSDCLSLFSLVFHSVTKANLHSSNQFSYYFLYSIAR